MQKLSQPSLLKTTSYINGQWQASPEQFAVLNPATDEVITKVADAGVELVEKAIAAAVQALPKWQGLSANERATLLKRWYELIMQHQNDLAILLTSEQGKPLTEAAGEIAYGASYIEWFSEEGKRAYGDVIPAPSSDKHISVVKQGVGVVTAITPWNFPNAMIARKAAAALAAGCTFVVRPSELTPLSALALAELAEQAGIPAGVFNVVIGLDAPAMGKVLSQHKDVAKVSFTGSTAVGKLLAKQSADSVKKLSLELGGNAPFIVFDDADIDAAVKGAIAAKFRNAGQTCVCANRFFVHESIETEFTNKLIAAIKVLKIGNGLSAGVNLGPLIDPKAKAKVDSLIEQAVADGAQLHYKGESELVVNVSETSFVQPHVLTQVTNEMSIAQQEVFGPVVSIISFHDEATVIKQANDTDYGLAGYFYTENLKRVFRVAKALDFGMLGINEGIISNAAAPFGGVKQSGYGREGSKYGLEDYMSIKYLCFGGLI
ncbi:NAD-dependent succinate-semialdehyde dehydrogenase [Litorilituus sediminis]|uniref:NAD-dependent succinate-semialdehyde dehydrogenase n=1 Tax=Litorilituus sediminis TaxID=718192 RepID=A0A4P6P894_9GAMM|nr:NAD-dependent succinate-semialdehyde dehydrogenase [Litorilituus sediminis]QBG37774.1 NAD-dependent succinate-semialdehyde dehydrogenase [Litorilituus sediminis]